MQSVFYIMEPSLEQLEQDYLLAMLENLQDFLDSSFEADIEMPGYDIPSSQETVIDFERPLPASFFIQNYMENDLLQGWEYIPLKTHDADPICASLQHDM